MTGEEVTVASIRAALVLYLGALACWASGAPRWRAPARLLWSGGLAFYLLHVVAAFAFVHGWSHQHALAETARQTAAVFGVATGIGLWFNHIFTLVWTSDVLWSWIDADGYARRPRAVFLGIHGFMAFMFFNGAVVFASGPSRWLGLAASLVLPLGYLARGSGMASRAPR